MPRKPPPIVYQPSWSGSGGLVRLHARNRALGDPFIFGGILTILAIDLTAWGLIEVFRPIARTGCTRNDSFCYADPVPDLVTDQWIMAVLAAIIVVTIVGSIVLRHAIIVVLVIQILLAIIVLVTVLPRWADAAQQQNLLRACHYGQSGSCPGVNSVLIGAPAIRGSYLGG